MLTYLARTAAAAGGVPHNAKLIVRHPACHHHRAANDVVRAQTRTWLPNYFRARTVKSHSVGRQASQSNCRPRANQNTISQRPRRLGPGDERLALRCEEPGHGLWGLGLSYQVCNWKIEHSHAKPGIGITLASRQTSAMNAPSAPKTRSFQRRHTPHRCARHARLRSV